MNFTCTFVFENPKRGHLKLQAALFCSLFFSKNEYHFGKNDLYCLFKNTENFVLTLLKIVLSRFSWC